MPMPTDRNVNYSLIYVLLAVVLTCFLTTATTPADKTLYQRQIDALVYALYGLTEEEIAIVEGAGGQ